MELPGQTLYQANASPDSCIPDMKLMLVGFFVSLNVSSIEYVSLIVAR